MIPSKCEALPAAEGALPAASIDTVSVGKRAVQAVYYLLVLLIPIETINTIKTDGATDGITFAKLTGIALFGLALMNRRVCFRKIPVAFWMVAWYLGACALSQLRIPSYLDAVFFENQTTLLQMVALFLISANLFEDAKFRGAMLRFYGWWVTLIAVGMLTGVFGAQVAGIEGRGTILGQDPNVAAGYFALGAVCIAGDSRLFSSKWFIARFIMALFAITTLLAAILQTGSRGGLIVFASGILGLAFCGRKTTRVKRLLIAGAVIGTLGFMVHREIQENTGTAARLIDTWVNGETAGRTKIYEAAWTMIRAKPFVGYGSANNYSMLGLYLNYPAGSIFYRDTHNLLLAVLTEVGLVGAVPFIAAILLALWKAWRYGRRTGDALPFALMLAEIVINTSLTGYHQKLFWIVFGAAVACGLELDSLRNARAGGSRRADHEASVL